MSSNSAVELKGSMYTFLSLKLHSNDTASVAAALADKVQQAPGFFANTPVVVDLTLIEDDAATDARSLLEVIRQHKLVPVVVSIRDKESAVASSIDIPLVEAGTKKATREQGEGAPAHQKAVDAPNGSTNELDAGSEVDTQAAASSTAETPAESGQRDEAPQTDDTDDQSSDAPAALAMAASEVEYIIKSPKLVTKPVRSGQQVYALDTDLVVIGQVGPGAEIIATNNVHVYGPLRGRALCGVAGNTEARIFCQSLEAELVSVAGNYKVLEEIPEELRGKPAQIWFQNDKLMIEAL